MDQDNFLNDMENDKYVSEIQNKKQIEDREKELIKDEKNEIRKNKILISQQKKEESKKRYEEKHIKKDNEIDNDDSTPILGKDKRQLLNKINSYKQLFPDELKTFKLKKNPTTEELEAYIEEIQVIIEIGNVESFVLEGILQSLKMCENFTVNKKYDITGLSDLLKMNKQFNSLAKQLMLKYGCFMNTPPEYQLMMLVMSSSYIMINKNNNKDKLNDFFNEKI